MIPNSQEERRFFIELFQTYREDPVFFVEHGLGLYTWSKMREILKSIQKNKRTVVRGTHGSGKTLTAGCALVWFYNFFLKSRGITTAPTQMQVNQLLWTEINRIYQNSRILLDGTPFTSSIKNEEPAHDAIGFATKEGHSAEGFHAPEIIFIFDEAKGVPPWMWEAARGGMTGGHCRWLAISTTDGVDTTSPYYKAFQSDNWNQIHIDCRDTPFYTGEKFRGIEWDYEDPASFHTVYQKPEKLDFIQLATPDWEKECIEDWGEDSILYVTKCRAELVDDMPDCIVKLSNVYKMFSNAEDKNFDDTGTIQMGVDVARGGEDSSSLWKRKGLKIVAHETYNKKNSTITDTVFITRKCEEMANYDRTVKIKVDDTGVGGGVTDQLKAKGYHVIPVNFHEISNKPDLYPNVISEMWFTTADLIPEISCPKKDRLQKELVNRKQMPLDKKGRRVIESKESYKKRTKFKSPDDADGFLLCFYEPPDRISSVPLISLGELGL